MELISLPTISSMPDFHPSLLEAVRTLHARYPQTPFLTLGQTVLWDEPVKAAFCRALEVAAPEARMMAAIHDTDYFAKLPNVAESATKFVMLPHNDGSTRGLWSAAGEISCLLGSESVPSRHLLAENGVAFDRVAKNYSGGTHALLENETAAWGWRALVHTEHRPLIAGDVKLRDILQNLLAQMRWALDESTQIVPSSGDKPHQLLDWTNEYSNSHPDATLSGLYQFLTPKLWSMVRGGGSCNLETSSSLALFRFNTQTCDLPRFAFVDLFLNPQTRETARLCYDEAVRGSGIYPLPQLGEGALPFDVVIPNRGRGTLRVHNGSIFIDTEEPHTLCTGCDPTSVRDLARVLEAQFGPNVALVGKAVALISMLSAEFIFVFHEKASSYTSRTQEMNNCLRVRGVELPLHPMLRLQYATWDALQNVDARFHLPPHLARAFGTPKISATDFAARWKGVCDDQDTLREQLKNCASPRELMQFLASQNELLHDDDATRAHWSQALNEYSNARHALNESSEQTRILQTESDALQARAHEANARAAQIETQKGEHWRQEIQPLRARIGDIQQRAFERLNQPQNEIKPSKEERRAQAETLQQEEAELESLRAQINAQMPQRENLSREIETSRTRARDFKNQAKSKTTQRVALERNEETRGLRAVITRCEYEAELERLHRVRDTIITSESLRYTNYRPTAWWFPLVSPDGKWFDGLVATAKARLEEL